MQWRGGLYCMHIWRFPLSLFGSNLLDWKIQPSIQDCVWKNSHHQHKCNNCNHLTVILMTISGRKEIASFCDDFFVWMKNVQIANRSNICQKWKNEILKLQLAEISLTNFNCWHPINVLIWLNATVSRSYSQWDLTESVKSSLTILDRFTFHAFGNSKSTWIWVQ